MALELKGKKVAFEYEEQDQQELASGIVVPVDQKLVPEQFYTVTHIGDEVEHIFVGDKILFKTFAITKFDYEDKHYACVDEDNILVRMDE